MAHIADFMVDTTASNVGLNNYIARELSPHPSGQDVSNDGSASEDKEKYIWRMHQPAEPRKYQLFPAFDKLSVSTVGAKSPESETSSGMASVGSVTEKILPPGHPIRKAKEQSLVRRRKISVPELGPMTTVQEVAMDSPTIPGRPPLHERSISAPGNTWRNHMFGESMLSCISGPVLDEKAELGISSDDHISPSQVDRSNESSDNQTVLVKSRSPSPRGPLSPKSLAPLVIPTSQQRIPHHSSSSRLRNEFQRPEVPPKSSKPKDSSPYRSPYTPMPTTGLPTPLSALPTPQSAPEGRSSPKPWNTSTSHSPSPLGHSRGQSDASTTTPLTQQQLGHRRGESEGNNSVMARGRPPRRRGETNPSTVKPPPSRRSPSQEEQHAFASLPSGINAKDAHAILSPIEFDALRKQALGQAARFEVLRSKDVEALSRELRGLDERCDYLRKTHRSLRSGRRNLHDRICSYLRSPRVAKFSHESILKQEEALSELDTSIDDWVTKLEQAENRRTRIRQKLLEHVAAALIMPSSQTPSNTHAANNILTSLNTPPRSPTKREALSPQRVVEEVRVASPETTSRGGRDVQSIRIYADSDVYALLADVEQEITRMGELSESDLKKEKDKKLEVQKQEQEKKEKKKAAEENVVDELYTLSATTYESLPARTYTPPIPYNNTVSVRN